ncbi:MAG: tripartite tricarboxylate transporter substrate binding protein [Acetobacteraceae bacterium]|nr:tripartite tricarboxylate transporter substrate binding protein [Acetobacteraceae bacterium]
MSVIPRRALIALAAVLPGAAAAQPGRPVSLVVPFPAGGDTDVTARFLAERLSPRLGRPVVVENRSGASGTIGALHVARAAPDGDTLLFAPSTFATAPVVLRRGASYDPVRDFVPIALTTTAPLMLVAGRSAGIRSVAELRAQAQAGRLTTYGTPGSGSPMHILGQMFNRAAGIELAEVAYRGLAPLVNDLLSGTIALGYVTPAVAAQHVRADALVPLAVSERERSPVAPDVPSFAELGFPDLVFPSWSGVFAPRGTPGEVAASLSAHFDAILAQPEVRARLAGFAVVPGSGDPARLAAIVADQFGRIGRVVRELNISVE